MKFFFSKTDSLYKIFKDLEKIPSHRDVEIFIDPEHSLFDNERRWQQIKEILEKKQINATFTTKNKKNKDYLKSLWFNVNFESKKHLENSLHMMYLFLSEHNETIMYNVRYYPNNDPLSSIETRFLYVPYYTWHLDYKYDLTISTANSKYISNPSYGKIKIYNKKEQEYVLVKGTQFITNDWLIFRADEDFILSTWSKAIPSETIINVQADEYDQNWDLIGIRWNINFKTQMLIKNLDESYLSKDIWAESIETFAWWQSESVGTVTDQDIEQLKQKLIDQVYDKKIETVSQNFPISWWFILPFESITTTTFNNIELNNLSWDNSPTIKWTAYVTYNYKYVMREDLYKIFMTYIQERQPENNLITRIDPSTVQFLKDTNTTNQNEIKKSWNIYSITTQIETTEIYNFEKDSKQIFTEIKDKISWMNIDDARNFILSTYEEIWSVKISLPLRYNSIPIVKSRIKISLNN